MEKNNLVIHAEVEGADSVQVYEGNSYEEAKAFADKLENVNVLQCEMKATKENGEGRSLVKRAKGEDVAPLHADIKSWLEENA